MLYPYPEEARTYTREISRVFGFLGILFALFLPPTGFIMGIIGLVYEAKDAKEHGEEYNYMNLGLNALGMVIGALYSLYIVMFKMHLF